jgi:alpha-tubulin suppressor-like RCC1 family protein
MAITSAGTLWACGYNGQGQLGLSDTTNRSSLVQVGILSGWSSIAPGQTFTTAIQNNATLWSWGNNTWGQLGLYNPAAYSITNYPSQFGTGNYNKVTASNSQSYFRRTVNNVVVQTSTVDIPTIDATQTIGWNSYDTGQNHFIGVQSNGTAWGIGNNSFGQLGLNTTTSFSSSLTQIGSGTNWTRAIAADFGSMLINNSNVAWVFGKNNQYQLGLSDNTNRSSPVQITYATGIRNAAMDDFDIWLIDGNNNLWGGGVGNKVSANTTTNFTYPTQKFTSNFWNNVATNQDSTLLVGANSAIYGFGNNTFGQLGISANTNTYQFSPVQIGSINTTTKVETKAGSSIILFK